MRNAWTWTIHVEVGRRSEEEVLCEDIDAEHDRSVGAYR